MKIANLNGPFLGKLTLKSAGNSNYSNFVCLSISYIFYALGKGWKDEVYMSYLPLSHVAGLLIDLYMSFCAGSQIHFADKNALKGTLIDNLQRVRPTKFVGVPRVWEKIAEGLQNAGKDTKGHSV